MGFTREARQTARDRLLPLCPLAEKGALVLAVLAAVRGGASLSCVEGTREGAPGAAELLRPTVLLGDSDTLETLLDRLIRAENFFFRNPLTRPLAASLTGRKIIKSLGGNVRCYGITGGKPLSETIWKNLRRIHLPAVAL